MNRNIRAFVLHNPLLRELFFLIRGKKINRRKIDRKIKDLSNTVDNRPILNDVIVSLTSYGDRLDELQYALYSLVTQTVRPEKILVNLAKKDYEHIPNNLHVFEKFGVSFVETEDLRSYKKLIPTLKAYPDKCIVTADDDLFYPNDWLEKMWRAHQETPHSIVCHLTAHIEFENGRLLPYRTWKFNKKETDASFQNLILSGAGALFPPHSLHSDVCHSDVFMSVCPFADDLWDYFMALLQGTKIRQIAASYVNMRYVNPYREYGVESGVTLTQINVEHGKNDEQLRAILEHYKLTESMLYEKSYTGGGYKCISSISRFLLQIKFILVAFLNFTKDFFPYPLRNLWLFMFGIRVHVTSSIHRQCRFFHIGKFSLGRNSTVNFGCYLDNRRGIKIGDNTAIAHDTKIYTLGHNIKSSHLETKGSPVKIGDNVFIFANVLVMPGIEIGDGAIVLPGSVVTKSVDPFTIVGGNPAKFISKRDKKIDYITKYNYWLAL